MMQQPLLLGYISEVLTGKVSSYSNSQKIFQSAISKIAVNTSVMLTQFGLASDEQADSSHHGGYEKALHHYAFEHYAYWKKTLGSASQDVLVLPGAFGENISTTGMTEESIHFRDQLQLGSCIVEVSQSRQPCWKLNYRFSTPDMALRLQKTGKTGWYYRILQPGSVCKGDAISLLKRPYPEWPLTRVNQLIFCERIDITEHEAFAKLALTESWKKLITKRLHNRTVEDMTSRLYGAG